MTGADFHIPMLTTERLVLRAPRVEDFDAYAEFYADDASAPVGGPLKMRDAWRRFCADVGHWTLRGHGWWTVDDGEGAAGACGIRSSPSHEDPELGWLLFRRAGGRGYATEAARAARDWWMRGHARLTSNILPGNQASEAVARRMGAEPGRPPTHNPDAVAWTHRRDR